MHAKLLIFLVLLTSFSLAYEFCDPIYTAIYFNEFGNITDIEHSNSLITGNSGMPRFPELFYQFSNKTLEECKRINDSKDYWAGYGVFINEVRCDRGRISFNDSSVLYFTDHFVAVTVKEHGCVNSSDFPFETRHVFLSNARVFGYSVSSTGPLFITQVSNNPFSNRFHHTQNYWGTFSPEENTIFQNLLNDESITATSYYQKYRQVDSIWIFDNSEKNRIVTFGLDYPLFSSSGYNPFFCTILAMKTEGRLNQISLRVLADTRNEIQNIIVEEDRIEDMYLASNDTSALFGLLSELRGGDGSLIDKLEREKDTVRIIKTQRELGKVLFETDEYPDALGAFVHPTVATSEIELNLMLETTEKEIEDNEKNVRELEQNIQNKIQLIESNEQFLTQIRQDQLLTTNAINQQWRVLAITIIVMAFLALLDLDDFNKLIRYYSDYRQYYQWPTRAKLIVILLAGYFLVLLLALAPSVLLFLIMLVVFGILVKFFFPEYIIIGRLTWIVAIFAILLSMIEYQILTFQAAFVLAIIAIAVLVAIWPGLLRNQRKD